VKKKKGIKLLSLREKEEEEEEENRDDLRLYCFLFSIRPIV
jgi:hypothetical protein